MNIVFHFKPLYSYTLFILYLLFPQILSEPLYYYYDIAGDDLIPLENDGTVPGTWRPDSDVKILVHGWNPLSLDPFVAQYMIALAREYGEYYPLLNIILVDWTYRANTFFHEYDKAVEGSREVGEEIADLLQQFYDDYTIDDFSLVHCLGHSLGAHVCGVVGYEIQQNNGGLMIGRITGLDPAGPSFTTKSGNWPDDLTRVLDNSDAEFVDIIHTNMGKGSITDVLITGRLGSSLQAGHIDFYPNGGEFQKFQCDFLSNRLDTCSHQASILFYVLSLRYPTFYVGCPCATYAFFLLGFCKCSLNGRGTALGELATRPSIGGKHFLLINTQISEFDEDDVP